MQLLCWKRRANIKSLWDNKGSFLIHFPWTRSQCSVRHTVFLICTIVVISHTISALFTVFWHFECYALITANSYVTFMQINHSNLKIRFFFKTTQVVKLYFSLEPISHSNLLIEYGHRILTILPIMLQDVHCFTYWDLTDS